MASGTCQCIHSMYERATAEFTFQCDCRSSWMAVSSSQAVSSKFSNLSDFAVLLFGIMLSPESEAVHKSSTLPGARPGPAAVTPIEAKAIWHINQVDPMFLSSSGLGVPHGCSDKWVLRLAEPRGGGLKVAGSCLFYCSSSFGVSDVRGRGAANAGTVHGKRQLQQAQGRVPLAFADGRVIAPSGARTRSRCPRERRPSPAAAGLRLRRRGGAQTRECAD